VYTPDRKVFFWGNNCFIANVADHNIDSAQGGQVHAVTFRK